VTARTDHYDRCASLILNGFETSPELIAEAVGYPDVSFHAAGDLVGPRVAEKSRVTWRLPMFADDNWDTAILTLIDRLGGTSAVRSLIEREKPQAAWLRLNVPLVGSPWQESNGLDNATLRALADLGVDFDVAAFDYDESRPTHRQAPKV
jgi:hypothetical protein